MRSKAYYRTEADIQRNTAEYWYRHWRARDGEVAALVREVKSLRESVAIAQDDADLEYAFAEDYNDRLTEANAEINRLTVEVRELREELYTVKQENYYLDVALNRERAKAVHPSNGVAPDYGREAQQLAYDVDGIKTELRLVWAEFAKHKNN